MEALPRHRPTLLLLKHRGGLGLVLFLSPSQQAPPLEAPGDEERAIKKKPSSPPSKR